MNEPENHRKIFLSPVCHDHPDEGRQWCQDDVFECECGYNPPHPSITYIRADIAEQEKQDAFDLGYKAAGGTITPLTINAD